MQQDKYRGLTPLMQAFLTESRKINKTRKLVPRSRGTLEEQRKRVSAAYEKRMRKKKKRLEDAQATAFFRHPLARKAPNT